MAGLALGYLLFSPRRSGGLRTLLLGSLVPTAAKGMHGAWDGVRKSRSLSDFGDRVSHMGDQMGDRISHMSDQVGERFSHISDQVGDRLSDLASRASKLRRRW